MGCAHSNPKVPVGKRPTSALQPPPEPTERPPEPPREPPSPPASTVSSNPGSKNLVWNLNGKIVDVVVNGEDVLGLEPGYEPPPRPPAEMERARCKALSDLGLDLHAQEKSLDAITKLLGDLFKTPGAFIQLVDDRYTYLKSASIPVLHKAPSDRNYSLTSWLMLSLKPEMLVVEDLTADKRFKANPFVRGPPFLRACAMAPLLDKDGNRLGALGVSDLKPRPFTAESCALICNFAEMAVKELYRLSEEQKARAMPIPATLEQRNGRGLMSYLDSSSECIGLLDMSQPQWPVLLGNGIWGHVTGWRPEAGLVTYFWDFFRPAGFDDSAKGVWEQFAKVVESRRTFGLDVVAVDGPKNELLHFQFKPASAEQLGAKVKIHAVGGEATGEDGTPGDEAPSPLFFATLKHASKKSTISRGKSNLKQYLAMAEGQTSEPVVPGVKLGTLLGKGSFGSVHKGVWNGNKVAVKILKRKATADEMEADQQQQEALIGLKLQHPNIVKTLTHGTRAVEKPLGLAMPINSRNSPILWSKGGSAHTSLNSGNGSGDLDASTSAKMTETWIVLELCNHGSLQEAIDRAEFKVALLKSSSTSKARWIPDLPKILRTATEIASAMAHLHSKEVLHADLNGNNVLLTRPNAESRQADFQAKVSDFGMSRVKSTTIRTIATQTYGTVTHMPPELLVENRLSKAADVYAFGVILWELYTGERPWAGLRHAQILAHKIQDLPKSKLQWPPGSHRVIKDTAVLCMLSEPHERPTFDRVVEILAPLQASATAVSAVPLPRSGGF